MKAVVAGFNQEKALVGAFYMIMNIRMELFEALEKTQCTDGENGSLPQVTSYSWVRWWRWSAASEGLGGNSIKSVQLAPSLHSTTRLL